LPTTKKYPRTSAANILMRQSLYGSEFTPVKRVCWLTLRLILLTRPQMSDMDLQLHT
jgi:hypothetical protein